MARITKRTRNIVEMEIINRHPDNGFSAVINAITREAYKDILYMATDRDGYKVKVDECWIDVTRNAYGINVTIECKDRYDAAYLADKIEEMFKEEDKGVEGEETTVNEEGGGE